MMVIWFKLLLLNKIHQFPHQWVYSTKLANMKWMFSICLWMICNFSFSQGKPAKFTEEMKAEMRSKIQEAAKHAWSGYKQFAFGKDDLKPLSKSYRNWYEHSLLMTPVDAFDTFILLGLTKEASEAKQLILDSLSFDKAGEVQVFEVTIRILGGLISAYEMDGDERFLKLAIHLADKLMPAFNSETGMPNRYVHMQTGKVRDPINNPAEIGSLFLEFGQLSKLTGNKLYFNKAKKAIMAVYKRRSKIALVGEHINIHNGKWVNTKSHIGGAIDSYYEYLYKGWKLFGDKDCKNAFDKHFAAIKKYLLYPTENGSFLQQVDMNSGKKISTEYGALSAFFAGLCAYTGDVETAAKIQQANYFMWTNFNIEPESFDFVSNKMLSPEYILRPENIESCFYLYRATQQLEYLWMAKFMTEDILLKCKTEVAFASLKNVTTLEKADQMESFFFAETLKYAYLCFDDSKAELQKIVFNTEAHPFNIKRK